MSVKELFSVLTQGQVLKSIFVLLIMPLFVGHSFSILLKRKKSIPEYYVFGLTFLFAVMEVICVPAIMNFKSFTFVYYFLFWFIIIFSLIGVVIRIIRKDFDFDFPDLEDIKYLRVIFTIGVVIFCMYFLRLTIIYQNVNDDDSRFVVVSVDMLEYDKMYLNNPATGEDIPNFILTEDHKDVVSPWGVYIAALSKFTGIKVVTMAHSIMDLALYIYVMCAWWLLAGRMLKKENAIMQGSFLVLILLMAMYGNDRGDGLINTVFMKFLYRLWQGKAVLASAGIPIMYISMFDYYKKNSIYNAIPIFVTNLAMCFMSANGIVIAPIMIGVFAVIYSLLQFKWHTLLILLFTIPNYYLYKLYFYLMGLR